MKSAEAYASDAIEVVRHGNGYQSIRFIAQSSLLWHSGDNELMEHRRAEIVQSVAGLIREAQIDAIEACGRAAKVYSDASATALRIGHDIRALSKEIQ